MPETSRPDSFDAQEACRMSFLALVALCDKDEELKKWADANGFDDAKRIKCGLNRAVILHQPGTIRVVFAGTQTQNWDQWLTHNLALTAIPHQLGGMVYEGFSTALHSRNEGDDEDLCAKVLKETGEMRRRNPGEKLIFSGHSLGGAMCALAMDEVRVCEKLGITCPIAPDDIDAAYALGSPRIGNEAFARAFNETYGDRFHNGVFKNDPVPRLPLEEGDVFGRYGITGMRAVGTLHYLDGNGNISFRGVPKLSAMPGRGPHSFHHLPQYYERAYGKLCGMENPYEMASLRERINGAIADYREMADACEKLVRSMPSVSDRQL